MIKFSKDRDVIEFHFELVASDRGGVGYYVPFDVNVVFSTRGQVKVKVSIDGYDYRSSIAPMGDGSHAMIVPKKIRDSIGKSIGDTVHIIMERDVEPRIVILPDDFKKLLEDNTTAMENFEKMPYTMQKELVLSIIDAKRP